MKKSVYSLVLADEIVAAVDRAAYERGVNRSYLINQILAGHLQLTTPEMRMRCVLDAVCQTVQEEEGFRRQSLLSDSAFSAQSALQFRYHPVIHYSVRLVRGQPEGQFKLQARTQNAGLTQLLGDFFAVFMATERALLPFSPQYEVRENALVRQLVLQADTFPSDEALGSAIGSYICAVDRCLKAFCALEGQPQAAAGPLGSIYQEYLQQNGAL